MRTIVLVALEDIDTDQELFLNYRLNPALQRPSWYSAVDLKEDLRRWS
jgi:hypothetical protein